ncbi:hypothetical protein SAMN06296056_103243 [Priestia filamentosa]|nr:hypothetical protein SAMN06296056_103243 [Priestia filamentosa]
MFCFAIKRNVHRFLSRKRKKYSRTTNAVHKYEDKQNIKEETIISQREENQRDGQKRGFVKNTSNEVNELFHKTVDTANNIVKGVSGKGGLVGKVTDTSSNILKGTSSKANEMIGKSADTTGKMVKKTKNKFFGPKK